MKRSAPMFFSRSWWTPKRIALTVGFLLTTIGALAPQFYVGVVDDRAEDVDASAKSISGRIENIRAAQSQYLSIQQMGALVFSLSLTGTAAAQTSQETTLNRLYQLSFLDRSFAIRQMLGELALAGRLTYREASDRYNALILDARQHVSLSTYRDVDDFEADVMRQTDAWMANLQLALQQLQRRKGHLDALSGQRKLQLLVIMTLGSSLLLAANLISEKPSQDPKAPETPEELAVAAELAARVQRALAQSSDRGATQEQAQT